MEQSQFSLAHADLMRIEECLWVLTASAQNSNYDFPFDRYFRCRHGKETPEEATAVARMGAIPNYDAVYDHLQRAEQITLVHSPAQYRLATELPHWYPLIQDLTPKSLWFTDRPDLEMVGAELGWPIFMKGARQTSRHQKSLSIIDGPESFRNALELYAHDPILRHQQMVCREFVKLRLVDESHPTRIASAYEYRTFWWQGQLVGWGRYWWEGKNYQISESERAKAIAIAQLAASRLQVPFLVVDIAQTLEGKWLVIECNDGQESGYGGITPVALWQKIIDLEKAQRCIGD